MATQKIADRVKDTAASITGTGSYTLANSPPTGFVSFNTGIGDTNSTVYCATDGTNWEVCFGTYTNGTLVLTRNLLSSSTGSLISWSAATPTIFVCDPAELSGMFLWGISSGRHYASLATGTLTTGTLTAGQLKAVPILVTQFFTSITAECNVTALFAGTSTVDIGVYDNANGAPNNQIGVTTGINVGTSGSTGAIQSAGFTYVGRPGLYWGMVVARTNSPTFEVHNSSVLLRGLVMGVTGGSDTNNYSGWTLTSGSNPNPFSTPTAAATGSLPVMSLLVS